MKKLETTQLTGTERVLPSRDREGVGAVGLQPTQGHEDDKWGGPLVRASPWTRSSRLCRFE